MKTEIEVEYKKEKEGKIMEKLKSMWASIVGVLELMRDLLLKGDKKTFDDMQIHT